MEPQTLFAVGFGLAVIGHIGCLCIAFRQSILWGLVCLFVPPAYFIFLLLHLDKVYMFVAIMIVGFVLAYHSIPADQRKNVIKPNVLIQKYRHVFFEKE